MDTKQLKRNRAKISTIAAGLFILGSQGTDFGDAFNIGDDHRWHHSERFEAKIDEIIAKIEQAAEKAERKGNRFSPKIGF